MDIPFLTIDLILRLRSTKGRSWPEAAIGFAENYANRIAALRLRFQPIDATHWLNRSAGVLKSNVFLGRSLSCRATAFNRF